MAEEDPYASPTAPGSYAFPTAWLLEEQSDFVFSQEVHDRDLVHSNWGHQQAPFNPTTPPNPSVHFRDVEATTRPLPRDLAVLNDSEMSVVEAPDEDNSVADIITNLLHRIEKLQRAARSPPPPPTRYQNDPALVERLATLTTKVTELESLSLLLILQSGNPPSQPPDLQESEHTTRIAAPCSPLLQLVGHPPLLSQQML